MNNKIKNILIKSNVLYEYKKGDRYHPVLTSGLHSNVYINLTKMYENTTLTQMMIKEIFPSFEFLLYLNKNIASIGGLLTLGSHIVTILTETYALLRDKQRIIFPKDDNFYWSLKDIKQPLLLVDDVITTGKSIKRLINKLNNVEIIPYIVVLINRYNSDRIVINNKKYEILSSFKIKNCKTWEPFKCPLCNKFHSIPIKPKNSWSKLMNIS